MAERWVLNASPLILLSRIGEEGLLFALADQIVVPQAVVLEILVGSETDPARSAIESGRFQVVTSPEPPDELLASDLGQGETSVLSSALAHPGWTAILDDGVARRCARSFDVPVKGTLAIVVSAR